MRGRIQQFISDRSGATAVEYGLICALIVIAAIAGISVLGGSNTTGWGRIAEEVVNAS